MEALKVFLETLSNSANQLAINIIGRDIDGVEEDAIFSEAQQKLLQRTKTEDEDTLQGRVVIETADTDILDLWPPKERIPYEIHTSIESGEFCSKVSRKLENNSSGCKSNKISALD